MTPEQHTALQALAGRPLTEPEQAQIASLLAAPVRPDEAIAAILSAGRTAVRSRIISARGIAELMPGGPIAAEVVLMKLEGARDAMLASAEPQQQVLGSLLRRQLRRLDDEGLDLGSAALRSMLDQFAALGVLTAGETAALKGLALQPAPVAARDVTLALNGA